MVWASLVFLSSAAIVISDPGIVITAETLGLELPFAWTLLPFDTLYVVITFVWFLRGWKTLRQHPIRPEWTRVNTAFLVLAVLLTPLAYILFNAGELHGKMDQAAVALTFIQYIIINLSLIPWRARGPEFR